MAKAGIPLFLRAIPLSLEQIFPFIRYHANANTKAMDARNLTDSRPGPGVGQDGANGMPH